MTFKKENCIGILGGGQLGKMLCESAQKKGYRSVFLDPQEDACSKLVADEQIIASYNDEKALLKIAKKTHVITYEFENVTSTSINIIEANGGYIPQGIKPLNISQNRIREKNNIKKLGIKTTSFGVVRDLNSFDKVLKEIGYPCILKTCEGGYDGKGQWVIRNLKDSLDVKIFLNKFSSKKEYILEKMIDFKCELSCLVVKSTDGSLGVFPVSENIHKNGILHLSIVPARISKEVENEIKEISKKIINGLDFVGPLAIEYFYGEDEEIYVNEIAPRPHNSFHYTMDACDKSQFDLHIDSICGEKIENPKLLKKVVMLNILGQDIEKIEKIHLNKNEILHMYGKSESKINRKMGHLNIVGDNFEEVYLRIEEILNSY